MPTTGEIFEFGPFRLEPAERRLVRGPDAIGLTPKAFDLLAFLVEHADRLLKKEELLDHLWPGVFVEEVNLAQNISAIRRALGGEGRESYIQTVAGTGYRFIAPVRRANARAAAPVRVEHAAADSPRKRLLVLPFRMLKADPELDFLGFSLPDALTAELSSFNSLIVRSSLIAARFAGDAPDLQRIAREAQVDYVVSGTLLRAADQLRVSAQLADASAGTLIWSHTAQAPVGDLFQLQDLLVARITESLSLPLTTSEQRVRRHDVPRTARAYELFLRANEATPPSGFSLERATIARDLYLQALDEDPAYAPAWTRLARVYRLLGKYQTDDDEANVARADHALQRALALNPDLWMAHNLAAQIEVDRGRAERAMVILLGRLQQVGPHAELYAGLVQACRFCGLLEASIAAFHHAQRLDAAVPTGVMHSYFILRRFEETLAATGQAKAYIYCLSLDALGRKDEALAQIAASTRHGHKMMDMLVAARALIEGKAADSAEAMHRAMTTFADPEAHYYAARHFARLNKRASALESLARSIQGGHSCLGPLSTDPWFDSIRSEPEFPILLNQARERHESAAVAFRNAGGPQLLGVS